MDAAIVRNQGDKTKLSKNSQAPVKKSLKSSQAIPAVILIVCVVGALYFSGFFSDMGISIPNFLSPTRDIEGTWKTAIPTQFTIATDANSWSIEDVGTENRTVTFKITGTSQENIVNVEVTYSYSNRQLISGSGYIPDVSPMTYKGTVNGTQLTITQSDQGPIHQIGTVGVFTFTTHQMEGTWHDHWEGVYEQNVYTQTNTLKLIKQ